MSNHGSSHDGCIPDCILSDGWNIRNHCNRKSRNNEVGQLLVHTRERKLVVDKPVGRQAGKLVHILAGKPVGKRAQRKRGQGSHKLVEHKLARRDAVHSDCQMTH